MPKSITFDKKEVIEQVMSLFWKKGYNGTSMQDLVDVTGLNRSSFYNTFGDKYTLFEEAQSHYQDVQLGSIEQMIAETASPLLAIKTIFEGLRQEITEGRGANGCFFSNCISELSNEEPRIKNLLLKGQARSVQILEDLVIKAQSDGEINPSRNAKSIALYLMSSIHGIRITSMIDTEIDLLIEEILHNLEINPA